MAIQPPGAPAVHVAAPAHPPPIPQLPSIETVKAELDGVKADASGKIALAVITTIAVAIITATVLAIGFATAGVGLGAIAIAMAIIIPTCIAAGGVGTFSDQIAQRAVPRELDLFREPFTFNPRLYDRYNTFMERYHPMDPVTANQGLPVQLPGETFPLFEAKEAACVQNPANPSEETLQDLLIHRRHGEACDFLWDIYTREHNLKNTVELALSIAAVTKKTKSRLHPGYYEENRRPVQELLLKTYRDVQANTPPTPPPLSPEDRAGALNALAQMYHLMQ
jgi:hypothetical protein